ncbi:hypothetical protein BaRGS_00000953, partial [Batillaria attramentaria]
STLYTFSRPVSETSWILDDLEAGSPAAPSGRLSEVDFPTCMSFVAVGKLCRQCRVQTFFVGCSEKNFIGNKDFAVYTELLILTNPDLWHTASMTNQFHFNYQKFLAALQKLKLLSFGETRYGSVTPLAFHLVYSCDPVSAGLASSTENG